MKAVALQQKNKKYEEKYTSLKSGYAGIREIHKGKERFMKCVGHYKPQNQGKLKKNLFNKKFSHTFERDRLIDYKKD